MEIPAYWPPSRWRRGLTKTLRIMKISAVLLFTCCLSASAGTANSQKITLKEKDAPLVKVLHEIEAQSGYQFFFSDRDLQQAKPINIDAQEKDLAEVLKECFFDQPFSYEIVGKTIVVRQKEPMPIALPDSTPTPRLIRAQGIVYNESGQPMSGANVTIKTTGKGTITNAKGEFDLPAVPENSPLLISFIGYAPQVAKVSEGKSVQVYLTLAKNELDKVVVQAYGTTSQRLATGSIVTVSKEQIERQPVMNVLATLEGNVPGMTIKQTSGYASAPFRVEIRGRSEIGNAVSEPLYIIDGVPLTILESEDNGGNYNSGSLGFTQNGMAGPAGGQSPLFSINPADIESISVLKDADATAIYGSRGAHGVILITTKKGVAGKTKLDINVYQGNSFVTGRYKTLNTKDYLTMRREAFYNDSIQYGITPDGGNAYDLLTWDTTRFTDYQHELWGGIGRTTDVEMAINGGDKLTTFRIGGSYHHEKSILNYTGADQRGSIQFNLSHKSLNQRLSLSFTSHYSFTRSDLVAVPPNVATLPPNGASFLAANKKRPNFEGWQPVPYEVDNFSSLFQPYTAKTGFLNSQLKAEYELINGLKLITSLGYSNAHNSQIQIYPISAVNPEYNPKGVSTFGNNNNENVIIEPQMVYTGILAQGKLNVIAGASYQSVEQNGNTISGNGYVNDNLLYSISNAPQKDAHDENDVYKYEAVFARINYNLSDRYIINLSARRDGSSKFGPGRQFGNFGAIGGAWIFSETNWIKKKMSWLSFGKIRASYGLTGSDNIGTYRYLTRWTGNIYPYQNGAIASYIPIQHANPQLQWQTNKKSEIAVNLGFLKDRINIETAIYRNRCGNQLLNEGLPSITGFTSVVENFPALVQNQGVEIVLQAKAVQKNDFSLSINLNISRNWNKLVSYPNIEQSPDAELIIGKPLNIARLLHNSGVDPKTGEYTFLDKNHDGKIISDYTDTANDLFVTDLNEKYYGGFGFEVKYHSLQLNVLFSYSTQRLPTAAFASTPGGIQNISKEVFASHWAKPGDVAKYARFTTQPANSDGYFLGSDASYVDGSFIRCRNVSLSYDLSQRWLTHLNIPSCRFYLRGENLFLLTRYDGIDPQTPGFGLFPPSKVITAGIQINL